MAVAEKKKQLPEFLKLYKEKSNKASKVILKNLPVNAGEKPSSKRRKGKNNVSARLITEELDPQNVSHPKPPNYTEYFHNDEPFDVVFTRDHPQASQCTTCDVAFPRRMPMVPYDLAFVDKERWEYPVKDDNGKIVGKKVTKKKMTNRYYCLRTECVVKRHPYLLERAHSNQR